MCIKVKYVVKKYAFGHGPALSGENTDLSVVELTARTSSLGAPVTQSWEERENREVRWPQRG